MQGVRFGEAIKTAPSALRTAASTPGDKLFSTEIDAVEETFHLSTRSFTLQGQSFQLYLLKHLTRELSRQEVATCKKLIRVLSHELNNSLGPLSSLAHSGAEIARRGDLASLPGVFSAIGAAPALGWRWRAKSRRRTAAAFNCPIAKAAA